MVQLSGTYDNGTVVLDKPVLVDKPVKVLVTFMDEDIQSVNKRLTLKDFSFAKSRELLKDVHTDIAEAVIEERRSQL